METVSRAGRDKGSSCGQSVHRVGREGGGGTVAGGLSEEHISSQRARCSKLSTLDFTLRTIGTWSLGPACTTAGPPSKKVL